MTHSHEKTLALKLQDELTTALRVECNPAGAKCRVKGLAFEAFALAVSCIDLFAIFKLLMYKSDTADWYVVLPIALIISLVIDVLVPRLVGLEIGGKPYAAKIRLALGVFSIFMAIGILIFIVSVNDDQGEAAVNVLIAAEPVLSTMALTAFAIEPPESGRENRKRSFCQEIVRLLERQQLEVRERMTEVKADMERYDAFLSTFDLPAYAKELDDIKAKIYRLDCEIASYMVRFRFAQKLGKSKDAHDLTYTNQKAELDRLTSQYQALTEEVTPPLKAA